MTNLFDLSNKIAVVTGGSRGLGRQMVLAFANAGADVVIASRKLEACQKVAKEVEALGRRAFPFAAHVGKWSDNDALADAAYKQFGRVDVLVNNAGMSPLAPSLTETSEELFDKVIAINFKGPLLSDVLKLAGATGGDLSLAAADDYKVDIRADEMAKYNPILAIEKDGVRMAPDDFGPFFVMWPFKEKPEIDNEAFQAKAIWSVVKIEVK